MYLTYECIVCCVFSGPKNCSVIAQRVLTDGALIISMKFPDLPTKRLLSSWDPRSVANVEVTGKLADGEST